MKLHLDLLNEDAENVVKISVFTSLTCISTLRFRFYSSIISLMNATTLNEFESVRFENN